MKPSTKTDTPATLADVTAEIGKLRDQADETNAQSAEVTVRLDAAGPDEALFRERAALREKAAWINGRIAKLTAMVPALKNAEDRVAAQARCDELKAEADAVEQELPALLAAFQAATTGFVEAFGAVAGAVRRRREFDEEGRTLHVLVPGVTVTLAPSALQVPEAVDDTLLRTLANLKGSTPRPLSIAFVQGASPAERRRTELNALAAWLPGAMLRMSAATRECIKRIGVPVQQLSERQVQEATEKAQAAAAFEAEAQRAMARAPLPRHIGTDAGDVLEGGV